MSKRVLAVLDEPETCSDCYFRGGFEEVHLGGGRFKRISKCRLAPDTVEDPWRDAVWQLDNKEPWCPLIPIPNPLSTCKKEKRNV